MSRLTYLKDARSGLWATRKEVGYCYCQFCHGAKVVGRAVRAQWAIENRVHYVRHVTLGKNVSRTRTWPGVMARIRSVALSIMRADGAQNISLAPCAHTVSFAQLLALGTA